MRNANSPLRALLVTALVSVLSVGAVQAVRAQESSVNTFSPYTMYGVGDMNFTGSTPFAAMGGTSIGWRNGGFDNSADIRINTSNPASLSGLSYGRSLILDAGFAGSSVFLRQKGADGKTLNSSFNSFNLNNITVALPLARKLGIAVNVSPFSKIGYRMQTDDLSYLADLGVVRYYYDGEGDMTELKVGAGWEITKGLSIGAEFIYMWGDVNRTYQAVIMNYTGSGNYTEISTRSGVAANTNEKISRISGGFGLQYSPLNKAKSRLTIGLTYKLGGKLGARGTDFIPTNNIYGDTVRFREFRSDIYVPQQIGAGVYFHRPKFGIGVDYIYQDWGRRNAYDAVNGMGYVDTHTFKFGAQFTPNRRDIGTKASSFFNRITYRVGLRYGDYYMQFGGRRMNEKAVSVGLDIPFGATKVSNVSVGLEVGERGRLGIDGQGRGLIRERYFKFNVGVMLFGRDYDYWFEKYRYN